MKHKFKRFFQKIGLILLKISRLSNRERLNSNQLEASNIFRKLITNNKTELLISPISGKCYLRNTEKRILVVLSNMNISIINHIFGYDVSIPSYLYDILKKIFDKEVEERRSKMEDEYRKNVSHSLKQVLKSLKDGE